MTAQLDSFETALLAELRTLVSARGATLTPPSRPRRRRWPLAAAGVAATSVAALAVLPAIGPQPAYAVTVGGNGEVHVRVHRFEDASGLESALEAQGITAEVSYIADDMECAPGRYVDAPSHPGDFSFSAGAGYGYSIDLAPGVISADETLVIAASRIRDPDGDGVSDDEGAWVSVGVTTGKVAPCVPVPHRSPGAASA